MRTWMRTGPTSLLLAYLAGSLTRQNIDGLVTAPVLIWLAGRYQLTGLEGSSTGTSTASSDGQQAHHGVNGVALGSRLVRAALQNQLADLGTRPVRPYSVPDRPGRLL